MRFSMVCEALLLVLETGKHNNCINEGSWTNLDEAKVIFDKAPQFEVRGVRCGVRTKQMLLNDAHQLLT